MLILGHYGRVARDLVTDRYRDLHDIGLGVKYRANPLALAVALVQLERLPGLNGKRAAWFAALDRELSDVPGIHPQAVYPLAQRGGMLLYTGRIDPDETGIPTDTFLKALVAEGVPTQPGITPFGYGKMHLEPLFTDFPFTDLGGPWGSPGGDNRRPFSRGSLPVSEKLAENVFWLSTPVDPDPLWIAQIAAAFRKVVAHAPELA
jgi:dTDP-4-amino-4,6-dideoxygalactose transaminase